VNPSTSHSFKKDGGKERMMSMFREWLSKKTQSYANDAGYHFNRKQYNSYRGLITISGLVCICKADYFNG
jgi:hypothetical protein